MTNLNGVEICGKRGGRSFIDALRPTDDNVCPEMTLPCSDITQPENTICVSLEDKDAGLCPITEIMIMDQVEA